MQAGFRTTKIDSSQNCYRFYNAYLVQDLFSDWNLVLEWGRLGSPGTLRIRRYATQSEAEDAIVDLLKVRLTRRYLPQYL